MTTITIERDKAERWLAALEAATRFVYQDKRPECEEAVDDLRAALAAPATAPEKCGHCGRRTIDPPWRIKPATAPATAPPWQDAPTVPGLWVRNSCDCIGAYLIHESAIPILQGSRSRWFGPLPEDKQ